MVCVIGSCDEQRGKDEVRERANKHATARAISIKVIIPPQRLKRGVYVAINYVMYVEFRMLPPNKRLMLKEQV
jgi:hypothetical protein